MYLESQLNSASSTIWILLVEFYIYSPFYIVHFLYICIYLHGTVSFAETSLWTLTAPHLTKVTRATHPWKMRATTWSRFHESISAAIYKHKFNYVQLLCYFSDKHTNNEYKTNIGTLLFTTSLYMWANICPKSFGRWTTWGLSYQTQFWQFYTYL
jgi:hypothetical protein